MIALLSARTTTLSPMSSIIGDFPNGCTFKSDGGAV